VSFLRSPEEWGQHFLQSCDEVIGLAGTLSEVFNLVVLYADLASEKFILAFEAHDIGCCDLSSNNGSTSFSL
jgi:hypothetical protein